MDLIKAMLIYQKIISPKCTKDGMELWQVKEPCKNCKEEQRKKCGFIQKVRSN